MISLYSGTPGSGKSFHIADKVANGALVGRQYICNFPVDLEDFSIRLIFRLMAKHKCFEKLFSKIPHHITHRKIKAPPIYLDTSDITVKWLIDYAEQNHSVGKEGQTTVVIDEAGIKFNCRSFSDKDRQPWLDFFAKHRHYGFDFILISQSDRQLDRQIRYCIEQEYKHYKLANFNWFGRFLSWIAGGGLFIVHEYWYGFHGERNGTDVIRYSRRVAGIYDTHYKF